MSCLICLIFIVSGTITSFLFCLCLVFPFPRLYLYLYTSIKRVESVHPYSVMIDFTFVSKFYITKIKELQKVLVKFVNSVIRNSSGDDYFL